MGKLFEGAGSGPHCSSQIKSAHEFDFDKEGSSLSSSLLSESDYDEHTIREEISTLKPMVNFFEAPLDQTCGGGKQKKMLPPPQKSTTTKKGRKRRSTSKKVAIPSQIKLKNSH